MRVLKGELRDKLRDSRLVVCCKNCGEFIYMPDTDVFLDSWIEDNTRDAYGVKFKCPVCDSPMFVVMEYVPRFKEVSEGKEFYEWLCKDRIFELD